MSRLNLFLTPLRRPAPLFSRFDLDPGLAWPFGKDGRFVRLTLVNVVGMRYYTTLRENDHRRPRRRDHEQSRGSHLVFAIFALGVNISLMVGSTKVDSVPTIFALDD